MARSDSEYELLLDRWHYFYAVGAEDMTYPALDRRIQSRYFTKNAHTHERRLRALGNREGGLPRPQLAFEIGQCLWPNYEWSSGPIALWAAGRTSAFVGFIVSLLTTRPAQLIDFQRVSNVRNVFTPTIFDASPSIDDAYVVADAEMNDEQYESFRRSMRPVVPEEDEIAQKQRQEAWRFWKTTDKELEQFDAAWARLSTIATSSMSWQDYPEAFRAALSLASARALTLTEREAAAHKELINGVSSLLSRPDQSTAKHSLNSLFTRITRYSRSHFSHRRKK
jgi:hypothetical protein